jgi:hypothetical protein
VSSLIKIKVKGKIPLQPETQETGIPDLNEALHDEIQISQNAPPM